jgi:hypothetical protein
MKQRLGSKTARALLGLMLACAMLVGLVAPAGAVEPLPITCTAAGTVSTVSGQPDLWSISGQGSCQGDLEGTYVLSFTGIGSSTGLGLCPAAPGNLLVQDFGMIVTGTLTNLATGVPKALAQTWFAPLTTYPIATPFLIDASAMDDGFGAGSMFNHIFLNCSGTPVAQFTFAWLT